MPRFRIEVAYTSGSRELVDPVHEELDNAFRAALALESRIRQSQPRDDGSAPHSIEVLDEDGQMVISIMAYRAGA